MDGISIETLREKAISLINRMDELQLMFTIGQMTAYMNIIDFEKGVEGDFEVDLIGDGDDD